MAPIIAPATVPAPGNQEPPTAPATNPAPNLLKKSNAPCGIIFSNPSDIKSQIFVPITSKAGVPSPPIEPPIERLLISEAKEALRPLIVIVFDVNILLGIAAIIAFDNTFPRPKNLMAAIAVINAVSNGAVSNAPSHTSAMAFHIFTLSFKAPFIISSHSIPARKFPISFPNFSHSTSSIASETKL